MAGKSPLRTGQATLTFSGTHGLLTWQVWFGLFVPGSEGASYTQARDLWGVISESFIEVVTRCCSTEVNLRTCRLVIATLGSDRVVVDDAVTTVGGHASNIPEPVASVSRWLTSYGGRSGHMLTRLPGVPEAWLLDEGYLSNTGVSDTQSALASFWDDVDAYSTEAFPIVRLCCLRRVIAGAPAPETIVAFPDAVRTRLRLGTIAHRLRSYTGDPHSLVP